jgi:hypothetical protein
MRTRRYFGPIVGLVLSLGLAGTVLAGYSSDHWINRSPGTNTPIFTNINHTTFRTWSCTNTAMYLAQWDWMHHWPIFPSTGTQVVYYPCHGGTGVSSYTWSAGSNADYSVEYTHWNNSNVTTYWDASY